METLTPETLVPLLRDRLGASARCLSVDRGPIGNGQETWFLEVERDGRPGALVLRRSAPASTLHWTDRAQEYSVLGAVRGAGLPVPDVHWLETEPSTLDRPYFVMERMPGAPLGRANRRTRDAVARRLGSWLARLHGLDPGSLGLSLERPQDGAAAAKRELTVWRRRYLEERLEPVPVLGALLAWLEREAPREPAPVALLWGDPGPHNVLVDDGDVSALLDWELSHLGHPLEDLGAALWACLGKLDPELVIRAYERERGEAVDREALAWFHCLACVNRSIMLLAGVRAYVEGRTTAPVLAGLGLELLADNLERAAAAAGWPVHASGPYKPEQREAGHGPALHPNPPEIARGVAAYLSGDVLPVVRDRHLRRGLKTATALLNTAALRDEGGASVAARRAELSSGLLATLAAEGVDTGDVEEAAVRVERDEGLEYLRERTRLALLEDLRLERKLLQPLHDLYSTQL